MSMEQFRENLKKARFYEEDVSKKTSKEMRPNFHLTAPIGWMNDPNGFSTFRNEYHLFYQYHPYGTYWGPMHWGHVKSKDFVRWEYLPAALAPDETYDKEGCFSGSALEMNGKHALVYTGVSSTTNEKKEHKVKQVQCIAFGDGTDYQKCIKNPLITANDIPNNRYEEDFRDPKIWEEDGTYYMVVASRSEDKNGQIALFSSKDALDWNFVTILAKSNGRYGRMWECPDFFPLEDKQVLILSPQDMKAEGLEFHNGNNAIYFSGTFDRKTYQFIAKEAKSIDYGLDFYAPQTLKALDGRRIMIAWMKSWDTNFMPETMDWNGMMTFPRELRLQGDQLFQNPVEEIKNYYQKEVTYDNVVLSENTTLAGIEGRIMDLSIDLLEGNYKQFTIELAKNDAYHVRISYDPNKKEFTFDRTYSGLFRDVPCTRTMQIKDAQMQISIRILLDKFSAEIFVNDGAYVMSNTFFTPLEAKDIVFCTEGKVVANIKMHELDINGISNATE